MFVFDKLLQVRAALWNHQVACGDILSQHAREMQRVVGRVKIIALGDIERFVEHFFVLGIEPAIDIGAQEGFGNVEQKTARQHCHGDKSDYQARLQLGSD